jgi:hypothetical protein
MDMSTDLDLVDIYRRLLARWHWAFAAALVGGLLGLAASYLRPPVYEASAVIEIGIDRSRAEVPDDVTVRQAHDRVRGLLLADDTLEWAAQSGGMVQEGSEAVAALRSRIRLSEQPDGWRLTVLGASAGEAERLARAWADVSLSQIAEASRHAVRAAEWQGLLFEASCRLIPVEDDPVDAVWLCRSAPPGGADAVPASILAEVEASRGILPVFSYSLVQKADGTAEPVLWGRGSLILGGALAGLAAGGIAAALRRRNPRA